MRIPLLLLGAALLATGCTSTKGKTDENAAKLAYREEVNEVKTLKLAPGTFQKELVSNGKLRAFRKCELHFTTTEVVKSLNIQNGSRVQKGTLLAQLEDFEVKNRLEQSQQSLEKARLDLEDVLIGQGYDGKDTAQIPREVLRIAKLKSGFATATNAYTKAQHDYRATRLIAPFDGVVANLNGRVYDRTDSSKPFCTLIDNLTFEVEFSVMESEVNQVAEGQSVKVSPFANEKQYAGTITQINPVIDDNGLVKIAAKVRNTDGQLLEGMNVRVLIENSLSNQLIVPKSAVLLRQNKEVVFTHEKGTAIWHYVTTGQENSTAFTITDGLKSGDEVIVEGNLNLAHEAKVKVASN
ncbi:MAG: efflux RND transporter periplasmic adaptor subunit [Marinifilaceae bacterium]